MNNDDRRKFHALLSSAMEIHGKKLTAGVLALWWDALASYDYESVQQAFSAVLRDPDAGRYPPTPAAVIARMPHTDDHPDADEAWSIALESFDEAATVCVTPELLEARNIALPVYEDGDHIGARMTFRSAYERIVRRARAVGKAVQWQFSPGHDAEQRAIAAERAVEQGRIAADKVRHLLPKPEPEGPAAFVAGLLSGKVVEHPSNADARTRQRIEELRRILERRTEDHGPSEAERRKADPKALQERQDAS